MKNATPAQVRDLVYDGNDRRTVAEIKRKLEELFIDVEISGVEIDEIVSEVE